MAYKTKYTKGNVISINHNHPSRNWMNGLWVVFKLGTILLIIKLGAEGLLEGGSYVIPENSQAITKTKLTYKF